MAFQQRRLEALEHITGDFKGNKQTLKTAFTLPDLANFECKARNMATALDEFVTIERHVELGAWKTARLAPPERRVLAGDTLLVRYDEDDQDPETAALNRDNEARRLKHMEWKAANPEARQRPKSVMEETRWDMTGLRFRLRIECANLDCDLDQVLSLSTLREGARVVMHTRWAQDSRLPADERVDFTPTPKQLLYAMRVDITRIAVERDTVGRSTRAWVEVKIPKALPAGKSRGFLFNAHPEPLLDGVAYTLDSDPQRWTGQQLLATHPAVVRGRSKYFAPAPDRSLQQSRALAATGCTRAGVFPGRFGCAASGRRLSCIGKRQARFYCAPR